MSPWGTPVRGMASFDQRLMVCRTRNTCIRFIVYLVSICMWYDIYYISILSYILFYIYFLYADVYMHIVAA